MIVLLVGLVSVLGVRVQAGYHYNYHTPSASAPLPHTYQNYLPNYHNTQPTSYSNAYQNSAYNQYSQISNPQYQYRTAPIPQTNYQSNYNTGSNGYSHQNIRSANVIPTEYNKNSISNVYSPSYVTQTVNAPAAPVLPAQNTGLSLQSSGASANIVSTQSQHDNSNSANQAYSPVYVNQALGNPTSVEPLATNTGYSQQSSSSTSANMGSTRSQQYHSNRATQAYSPVYVNQALGNPTSVEPLATNTRYSQQSSSTSANVGSMQSQQYNSNRANQAYSPVYVSQALGNPTSVEPLATNTGYSQQSSSSSVNVGSTQSQLYNSNSANQAYSPVYVNQALGNPTSVEPLATNTGYSQQSSSTSANVGSTQSQQYNSNRANQAYSPAYGTYSPVYVSQALGNPTSVEPLATNTGYSQQSSSSSVNVGSTQSQQYNSNSANQAYSPVYVNQALGNPTSVEPLATNTGYSQQSSSKTANVGSTQSQKYNSNNVNQAYSPVYVNQALGNPTAVVPLAENNGYSQESSASANLVSSQSHRYNENTATQVYNSGYESQSLDASAFVAPPTPIITKHIYFHAPPPDVEDKPIQTVPNTPPNKIYNIVFIKVPSQEARRGASVQSSGVAHQGAVEDKTLIYVLVKKPDFQPVVSLPVRSQHEVFYVKYKGDMNNVVNEGAGQLNGVQGSPQLQSAVQDEVAPALQSAAAGPLYHSSPAILQPGLPNGQY